MDYNHRPWTTRMFERRGRGMTSPPLDSTYGWQRRAWHDITSLGLHSWSDDIRCGMTSPPLDSTHGRQRRAWNDITAIGQHTRSATSGVAYHHRPWTAHTIGNVRRGMTSPPLDSTHGRQRRAWTSEVALHHRPWAAYTVELRRAWHDITTLGQHIRSVTSRVT